MLYVMCDMSYVFQAFIDSAQVSHALLFVRSSKPLAVGREERHHFHRPLGLAPQRPRAEAQDLPRIPRAVPDRGKGFSRGPTHSEFQMLAAGKSKAGHRRQRTPDYRTPATLSETP